MAFSGPDIEEKAQKASAIIEAIKGLSAEDLSNPDALPRFVFTGEDFRTPMRGELHAGNVVIPQCNGVLNKQFLSVALPEEGTTFYVYPHDLVLDEPGL